MTSQSQYVADRIALMDVMCKYAKAVDEREPALYRSLFADDAVIEGFGPGPIHGADAWLEMWKQALEPFGATQHLLGPQLATIAGDTAYCRTDVQALHYLKDKPNTTLTLWATYEQVMRRIGGEWKIARHKLVSRGRRMQAD